MAQTVEFEFSLGEKVTITNNGRDGWVSALHFQQDGTQFFVKTTKESGEPDAAWFKPSQLTAIIPEV